MADTPKNWSEIHPDYRCVIDGKRFYLVLDEKGATVLAPYPNDTKEG